MKFSLGSPRLADSAIGALVNGAINGAIAWSAFKTSESIPLSMDSIAAPGVTALGNAATVAFALTLIMSCITFFTYRRSAQKSGIAPTSLQGIPFVPTGFRIALLNTLLVFGAFVAIAVLWQRFIGTLMVSPLEGTMVVAAVATIATAFAEWRTKREMLVESLSSH